MKKYNIYQRCEDFVVSIIKLAESIPYRKSVGIINDQLIRSSGSVGANLWEGDNSRTNREFLSYFKFCLKEIEEAMFWLRVLKKTNLAYEFQINVLEKEAMELKLILGSIYQKAKNYPVIRD